MLLDAVVLAGGKGTRLASVVSDVPKPLAPIGSRPFLDFVLDDLAASGVVGRVVLALGHLAGQVQAHYASVKPPLPLSYSIEQEPLGTGGAVLASRSLLGTPHVFVANGDSIVAADLSAMVAHHVHTGALMTMSVVHVSDSSRYGSVVLEKTRVAGFAEKASVASPGFINAGVYLFSREALDMFPDGPRSLERDMLPILAKTGRVESVITDGAFLDIGLPETYAMAPAFLTAFKTQRE